MGDREQHLEVMEQLEKHINKEVAKLKYYMEPADELIAHNNHTEIEIAVKQGTQIIDKITDIISQLKGMKLDFGVSAREVQKWKKDKKNGFSPRQQQRDDKIERQNC